MPSQTRRSEVLTAVIWIARRVGLLSRHATYGAIEFSEKDYRSSPGEALDRVRNHQQVVIRSKDGHIRAIIGRSREPLLPEEEEMTLELESADVSRPVKESDWLQ